ncbi:hypothetical protein VP01_5439g1 [Puccinia sorghi]|uniref:Uncharacterized protein n=1 Tax=Puccinia sorghi TaxID=27349 RepID=A0A0L6UJN4_9BASI|nr:hypothetical protein VP01_5439g1 [Puccinia sorghi]
MDIFLANLKPAMVKLGLQKLPPLAPSLSLHQLSTLKCQKTSSEPSNPHIKFCKLNQEVKLPAEDLYMEYHRKILLLSLEYSRQAVSIEKHCGQGQMQKENKWNKYMSNNDSAQQVFHDASNNKYEFIHFFGGEVSSTDSRNFILFDQLKEISDAMQIKGILVLASKDHTSHFFFQGRSFISQQYL